jgi:glycosyltransferase involved in cell wall biosynthesis
METKTRTILHLIETSDLGGAENVMINLVTNLEEDGYHSIVCLRKEGALYDELIKRGIEAHIINEEGFFDVRFVINLFVLVRMKKVSLIHAHEFLMNVYGTIVGKLSGRPVVTTLHGKFYYYEKWRRRFALQLVSKFSQLVCVSEDLRGFVSEKIGIPKNRIVTIYNGIDTELFAKSEKAVLMKEKFGIKNGQKVVGTVANLNAMKGHTYLLKAIPSIIRDYPSVVFLFVGKGDQEEKLRKEALDLGIFEYVKFLGFRSDIPELLNLMDVFVLPSLSECLPLSVLEAMALSVPTVVTDVGGIREIIKDQETGYIVPPADPAALADKISLLLGDRTNARSIGLGGREAVDEKFSIETMLAQYQSLYNSLF